MIINTFNRTLIRHIIKLGETRGFAGLMGAVIEIKNCPEISSPFWNIKVV